MTPEPELTLSNLKDIKSMVPASGYAYVAKWIGYTVHIVRDHAELLGVKPKAQPSNPVTLSCRIGADHDWEAPP